MEPEWGSVLRRAIHVASPVLLLYYLVPDDLGIGVSKPLLAAVLWTGTLVIELLRLFGRLEILGIRGYERGQVSAYFWGATGLLLGFLFSPPEFVVVAMCGMAWIDPLARITRRRGGYPYVPLVAYFLLALGLLSVLLPLGLPPLLLLAAVAAVVGVAAEYPSIPYVDDDFTMLIAPLVALTVLGALL